MNQGGLQKELKGMIREGVIYKRSKFLKDWQQKWAVLTNHSLLIFQDNGKRALNQEIELTKVKEYSSYLSKEDNIPTSSLQINNYYFSFQSIEEKWSWIVTLERLMDFRMVGASHYNSLDYIQTRGFKSLQEFTLKINRYSILNQSPQKKDEEHKREIERLNKVVEEQEKYFQKMLKEKYAKLNTIEEKMLQKQKKYEELAERLLSNSKKQLHQNHLEESRRKREKLGISQQLAKAQVKPLGKYELAQTIIGRGVAYAQQDQMIINPRTLVYSPLTFENEQLKQQLAQQSSKVQLLEDTNKALKQQLQKISLSEQNLQQQIVSFEEKKNVQIQPKIQKIQAIPYKNELVQSIIGHGISPAQEHNIMIKQQIQKYNPYLNYLSSQNQTLKQQLKQLNQKEEQLQGKINTLGKQLDQKEKLLTLKDKQEKDREKKGKFKNCELVQSITGYYYTSSERQNIQTISTNAINASYSSFFNPTAIPQQIPSKALQPLPNQISHLKQHIQQLIQELSKQKQANLSNQKLIEQLSLPLTQHTVRSYFTIDLVQSIVGFGLSHDVQNNLKINATIIQEKNPKVRESRQQEINQEIQKNAENTALIQQSYRVLQRKMDQKVKIIQQLQKQNLKINEEIIILQADREQLKTKIISMQKGFDQQTRILLEYRKKIKANAAVQQANRKKVEKELEIQLEKLQNLYSIKEGIKEEKRQMQKNKSQNIEAVKKEKGTKVNLDMKKIFQDSKVKAK